MTETLMTKVIFLLLAVLLGAVIGLAVTLLRVTTGKPPADAVMQGGAAFAGTLGLAVAVLVFVMS